jgi:hypothetical protein
MLHDLLLDGLDNCRRNYLRGLADAAEDEDLQLESWGGRAGLARFMSTVAEDIGKRLGQPCPRRSSRQSGQW